MATCYWWPTAPFIAQIDTLTVAGTPAVGNTISATVGISPNVVSVTYTLTGTDTAATAAAALQALLSASGAPPQFAEVAWTVVGAVITATAGTPGTPFSLASSASGGGATITHASVTTNSSPSDVNNSANWLRSGSQSLPQNGDDLIVSNSAVPLLWNLASLSAVTLNSYTRWQDFTGQIGLLTVNQNGYQEYRPTYFKLGSGVTTLPVLLGQGTVGGGPSMERYDFGSNRYSATIIAAGSAIDSYNVRLLGTHVSNVVTVNNAVSVGIAMQAGETSDLASATVEGGASLSLGAVTFSGQLTVDNAAAVLEACVPATLLAQNGSSVVVQDVGGTYATVTAKNGSTLTWTSNATISALTLQTSSTLDKSGDTRPMTITNATVDGDTTTVNDPWGAITFTNPVTVSNAVGSGPFIEAAGRSWQIT